LVFNRLDTTKQVFEAIRLAKPPRLYIAADGARASRAGEEEILLTENQSTYIPLGVKHRLENPGKTDLELIEVQSGSYLGEDDIVRFEDTYGRAPVIASEAKQSIL
jgi:mannose-1-phosphate guanylyltransferase / mannose-6-phosphate isomerase